MLPEFIRFFADTSDTHLGRTALEYAKSLCRIAPVRVISMTGGLAGPWLPYDELTLTPPAGAYVNCVCTQSSVWAYRQQVQAQSSLFGDQDPLIASHSAPEIFAGHIELYTAGVRNVLFLGKMPLTRGDVEVALKYEVIVCRNVDDYTWWDHSSGKRAKMLLVAVPGVDHEAVRQAVVS